MDDKPWIGAIVKLNRLYGTALVESLAHGCNLRAPWKLKKIVSNKNRMVTL